MTDVLEAPVGDRAPARTVRRGSVALFTTTSFLSAFLLFLVQPMIAKLVLPPYGGSPAVWNTTNAFFQATLLGGYAYSHVLTTRVGRRRQAPLHAVVLLLPLAALPLALPRWAAPPDDRPPALWLALVLVVAVGAPFLAVSTTGPLLQRWFSYTEHERADDPYFLYAAGNVGSFLALLAYPVVVEPRWTVATQARAWGFAYVALVVLVATCGWRSRTASPAAAPADVAVPATPAPTWRRRARWLVLAAIPSSLMLGVTSFMTADLAAVPMLWVLPLSLYLATFIAAFGRPARSRLTIAPSILTAALVATAVLVAADAEVSVVAAIAVHLTLFGAGAYVAHRKLALDRPAPDHLTGFYLVVALGGVFGGSWNAFIAPVAFDRVVEYPLAIAAVAMVGLAGGSSVLRRRYGQAGIVVEAAAGFGVAFLVSQVVGARSTVVVLAALLAVAVAAAVGRRAVPALGIGAALLVVAQVLAPLPGDPLLESRTFFGVYRVDQVDGRLDFVSGSTSHGAQDPSDPDEPLSYYTRRGPAGQIMATYGPDAREVGLVGLGVGTLAAYGEVGQHYTFYEIDPEVVRIARDSGHFTYLADSRAEISYEIGDGRLELTEPGTPAFDVLVLDAFSGDAVPVHLLTVEAVELYRSRLADGGVIAVHISNRYLDLRPVVAGAAATLGLEAVVRRDPRGDTSDGSWWVAVGEADGTLAPLLADERWHPADEAGVESWTDERSNLLAVLGTG